jgi:hypothetical protein
MNTAQEPRCLKIAADCGDSDGAYDSEGHIEENFGISHELVGAARYFGEGRVEECYVVR